MRFFLMAMFNIKVAIKTIFEDPWGLLSCIYKESIQLPYNKQITLTTFFWNMNYLNEFP